MSLINVDTEIQKYHKYLDSFEKKENGNLSPEIVKLRHHILFIHEAVESLLHAFIIENLIGSKETIRVALAMLQIGPVLEELDYYPLLRACKKIGLVNKNEYESLLTINNHRKFFSHPNAYKKEIKKYLDKQYYLQVLKDLKESWDNLISVADRLEADLAKRLSKKT